MLARRALPLALLVVVIAPACASAAVLGGHPHVLLAPAISIGGIFSSIGHALLGAFSWTVDLAAKFILTTIAALVRLLIPHSWVHQGLQIMRWIVAVLDYAGTITSPGGGTQYGFSGINALRDVFMWLGIAIAPLTLVYATSRAMIGEGDPVGVPLLRMLAVAIVIVSYPYWWGQASALADQVTNSILTIPEVSRGLYKLMDYAVDGVALGGWQLIDLGLMGAISLELLGLIFLKVVLILLGAMLYATGPLTIGLVPTRAGSALARAWASAVLTLFGIGVAWATLFAIGALLIGDASTAGPLIAGNSAFGSLAGGLLLAVAGLASLWLCLKAAKEAGALLRAQLSGLLVLAGNHGASHSSSQTTTVGSQTTGQSRSASSKTTTLPNSRRWYHEHAESGESTVSSRTSSSRLTDQAEDRSQRRDQQRHRDRRGSGSLSRLRPPTSSRRTDVGRTGLVVERSDATFRRRSGPGACPIPPPCSVARESGGEGLLFRAYAARYGGSDGDAAPALIPQVYLHYDPYTARELAAMEGEELPRQRMDFLLLLSQRRRIVVEVDGQQHYSDNVRPSPQRYAEMVAEDRRIRLAGYEVFRFGGGR